MKRRDFVLMLALGALGPAAAAQEYSARFPDVVEATTSLVPETAEIGEPLELVLDLVHPSSIRVRLDAELLEPGDGCDPLDERRVVTRPIAEQPGRSLTRARWSVCALEPGEHDLRPGGVEYEWGGTRQRIEAPPARVTIRHALADGEDAPRAPIGFREPPEERESPIDRLFWIGGLVLAGLLALVAWRVLRRRSAPTPVGPPGPAERLAVLRTDDPEKLRELYYELSAVVREALDALAGEPLRGCTDAEWIERRSRANGIPRERLERAAELLSACERVKYGAEVPTRWAVDEALRAAREIVSGNGNGPGNSGQNIAEDRGDRGGEA